MDQTSEVILALKPVTFHYKDGDTKKARETPQYGLIAEDVAAVNPDLIVRDKDGEPLLRALRCSQRDVAQRVP